MKKTPRYQAIAQDIIEKIQNGTFRSGDQLMTEAQLCEQYEVSRMTVNKALTSLVERGYISRTAGKGTFVLEPKVTKDLGSSNSFSSDMRSINKTPGAILVDYKVLRAGSLPDVQERLQLSEEELVHFIHRVRTSDGVRIAISRTYIPCKYLPALDVTVLEHSLYEYLDREYHIHPKATDYTFSALLPTARQKELLQVDSCALLKLSHCSVTEAGTLFEYTETCYAGNRYTYQFYPTAARMPADPPST